MERGEKIFLWVLGVGLLALIIWEVKSRSPIPQADLQASEQGNQEGVVPQPVMAEGPAYLVMNQPSYNPGPPVFNVMPAMAKAVALQNSGSCSTCG